MLVLCATVGTLPCKGQDSPLLETRGVWFATVLKDGNWPESSSDAPAKLEADLRQRVREIHDLGLNAIVFQTIARGDAQHTSQRLPWSGRIRGAGIDPGIDPLAIVIDEAHNFGIEVHAWVNVFRVGDATTISEFAGVTNPEHVYYSNPEWIVSLSNQLWLDPSFPDARSWMSDNVMEVALNYDVDGIHFDFIRYGSTGYPDDAQRFLDDPNGATDIDDWRRNNVTAFVEEIYPQIFNAKPWVKIGAAPLGNYTPFDGAWPALWAYDDVYQASRDWLGTGVSDYMAPQIYFDIGREPEPGNSFDSPDFAFLTQDWVSNSSGLPIYAGIGPFKSVVAEEIDTQIELSRNENARGQVFFRFDHIRSRDFSSSYPHPALPFPLTNRFLPGEPTQVANLSLTIDSFLDQVQLTWDASTASAENPLRGYAIFRAEGRDPVEETGNDLLAFRKAGVETFQDFEGSGSAADLRYSVVAVSRMGTRAVPSEIVNNTLVSVTPEPEITRTLAVESIFPDPARDFVNVQFRVPRQSIVEVRIYDIIGREVARHSERGHFGTNVISLPLPALAPGNYLARIITDTEIASQSFRIAR